MAMRERGRGLLEAQATGLWPAYSGLSYGAGMVAYVWPLYALYEAIKGLAGPVTHGLMRVSGRRHLSVDSHAMLAGQACCLAFGLGLLVGLSIQYLYYTTKGYIGL